jgi:ribonucleotide monophosphatase NagD (HAD superfamily)
VLRIHKTHSHTRALDSSGVEPLVLGKPSAILGQHIIRSYGLDPARTCMLGDRLDSDILFGNNNGFESVLVMTGCTSEEQLAGLAAGDAMMPTFVMDGFGLLDSASDV